MQYRPEDNKDGLFKDDLQYGKVTLRSWYDRNKHMFPANQWKSFDPEANWEKYTLQQTFKRWKQLVLEWIKTVIYFSCPAVPDPVLIRQCPQIELAPPRQYFSEIEPKIWPANLDNRLINFSTVFFILHFPFAAASFSFSNFLAFSAFAFSCCFFFFSLFFLAFSFGSSSGSFIPGNYVLFMI